MEYASGNIYIRPNVLALIGDQVEGDKHNFDHTTLFLEGAFHVKAKLPNGTVIERDFIAPSHCLILAEVEHTITALKPNSKFWCVYSHRTPQGDIVQQFTGWEPAYV
jgi:hypothetical protein